MQAFTAYFKLAAKHFSRQTEENNETNEAGEPKYVVTS
jgi:hypothetical protein